MPKGGGRTEAAHDVFCYHKSAAITHQAVVIPALQALGPEAVLAALPLNLAEGLAGTGEARTWLLPLLRMHVRGARLGYWGKVLLPLARELGARAAAAARSVEGWRGGCAGPVVQGLPTPGLRLCLVPQPGCICRWGTFSFKHHFLFALFQPQLTALRVPFPPSAATRRGHARRRCAAPWRRSCGPRCPPSAAGRRTRQTPSSERGWRVCGAAVVVLAGACWARQGY